MDLTQLMTPAFLVDLPRLKNNIQNMLARAEKNGVHLRPHVKTHKTAEIARMQVPNEASGITVSTLAEARFFQKAGFDDITYAFPITPNKMAAAAELTERMARFHILIDQLGTAAAVDTYGSNNDVYFSAFLKVDCGYHRAGVDPTKPESVQLVEQIQGRLILYHANKPYYDE